MFRFSLQRVLELRERQQRDAATALAAAQDAAHAARKAEDAILSARAELASSGAAPTGSAVGALWTTAFLLGRLDEQARAAGAATEAAAVAVAGREGALHAAFRDRRALDRLRDRHQIAWQSGAVAADRQQMDEIALSRFTQRAVRSSGAA